MTFRLLALLLAITTLPAHSWARTAAPKARSADEVGAPSPSAASGTDARHVETLLEDVLGPGKARVFIRTKEVDVLSTWEDTSSETGFLWDDWEERVRSLPPVLPGYSVPRSMQEDILRTLRQQEKSRPARRVTLRSVTLVLDPKVSEAEVKQLRALVSKILHLDAVRGDVLRVVRAPIHSGKTSEKARTKVLDYLLFAGTAAILLLLVFFLYSPRRRAKLFAAQAHPPEPEDRGARPGLTMLAPHHVRKAAQFLDGEPAQSSVFVLRTVPIEVAADLFRKLSTRKRNTVAAELLFQPPENPKTQDSVEGKILALAAEHEAGEGLLESLLLRSPDPVRREVLSRLYSRAPVQVRQIKERLVSIGDLAAATPSSLRTCLASFSTEDIAISLYEAPEDSRKAFLNALPDTVAEMVREHLKHLVPESYDQVHRIRANIYARWKRLEIYGRVRPLRPGGSR